MSVKMKRWETGNATLEYALILPVVFVSILAVIVVFFVLYQKALIQNLAEDAAQSLSRQWGYQPLPMEELDTGVYQKATYETREIYWHIKLWNNDDKEAAAEEYLKEKVMSSSALKLYNPEEASKKGSDDQEPSVAVSYTPGLPSTLTVEIKAAYRVPGLKFIGLGDYVVIKGYGRAFIYDSKDMINTTDYVIQLIRGTKTFQLFNEKLSPLRENLDKILKK